jgi:transposase
MKFKKYLGESEEYKAIFSSQGRKIQGARTGKLQLGKVDSDGNVTLMTAKEFISSKLPWSSGQKDEDNYFKKEFLMNLLKKEKNFGKKVDYNSFTKKGNPSFEDKLNWLLKNTSVKYSKAGV